jgi:glucokinase
VALPTYIDFAAQKIIRCVNLPLARIDVRARLQGALDLPVILDNDATLAALGEARFGAARTAHNFLMITLGTGVGGGIFIAGKPYRGTRGLAAEIGHMTVIANGQICPCGGIGHLEAYLGRKALGERAQTCATTPQGAALLAAVGNQPENITAETLLNAADTGDPAALNILQNAGQILGHALTTLVNLFNPDLILIAGGLGERAPSLITAATQTLDTQAPPGRADVTVTPAALGNDAGLLGAAALAFDEL